VTGAGIGVVALVMAVGLAGTLLPFVPGLALIWAAGLVFGLVDGFGTVGALLFALMTVLLAAGTAARYVLPARCGAGRGVPTSTLLVGAAVGVIGFFVVPVVGLPLGAALGVLLAERRRTASWPSAWDRTRSVIVGFGLGALAEIAAGLAMVLAWVAWVVAR
jgi:uncharacterized protein YqgC (DUF456 family)